MTQWYVKELSKLTGVSVRTLHHYDAVSLLKPSVRLANGYRLYSENDLSRLQQIIALKFFGFELAQIKILLDGNAPIFDLFMVQSKFLEEKANSLLQASKTLQSIIESCDRSKAIPWQKVISLIEVYTMTQRLEKTWAGKVLTPEQLKEYAKFTSNLKNKSNNGKKENFHKNWTDLVKKIANNLTEDPCSDLGMKLAKECMAMINNLYGAEHAGLRHSIWHNGYKKEQMDSEHALDPEIFSWLDKAMDFYYRSQIYAILDKANPSSTHLLNDWNTLMNDMFGDSDELKQSVIDAAMTDNRVTNEARVWLQQFVK